jgi:beta-lactamase regulating signal transducer with metallopeptidase domain
MKIVLIIWAIVIFICFLEAYFYSELDPESRRFLDERENKLNKEKDEHKSTS